MMSEQKSKHNGGRAYQCRYCLDKGKEYINERDRVVNHIRNTHLSPDQLPYYCQLCKFHCTRRKDLDDHVKTYRWHARRLFDPKGNQILDSPEFLKENPDPYVIGDQDYIRLPKEDSDTYFAQKREASKTSSMTTDLLKEAVQAIGDNSEVGLLANEVPGAAILQADSQEGFQADTVTVPVPFMLDSTLQPMWKMFLSMMGQVAVTTPLYPLETASLTSTKEAMQSETAPPPVVTEAASNGSGQMSSHLNSHGPESTLTAEQPPSFPLDLTQERSRSQDQPLNLSLAQVEAETDKPNEKPQCLDLRVSVNADATKAGGSSERPSSPDNQYEEPQCLDLRVAITAKAQKEAGFPDKQPEENTSSPERSSSPVQQQEEAEDIMHQLLGDVETTAFSPRRTDSRLVQIKQRDGNVSGAVMQSLQKENQALKEEIEKNSRTIRCLERTLERELKAQNQAIREVKEGLDSLTVYLRANAGEERRRRERKEEERKRESEQQRREEERKRRREEENSEKENTKKLKSVLVEVKKDNKRKK